MVSYYKYYEPSQAAAIVFIVIFLGLFLAHIFQMSRTKSWWYLAVANGAMLEGAAYIARYFGHKYPDTKTLFLAQETILLIAPCFFAASIHMVYGRLITALDAESLSALRVRWMTMGFLVLDAINMLVLTTGGGLMSDEKNMSLGKNVALVGLALQALLIGLWAGFALMFHMRMRHFQIPSDQRSWVLVMITMYATGLILQFRAILRIIMLRAADDSSLKTKEVFLYVFDAALMTLVVLAFNIVHPPSYLKKMATAPGPDGKHLPLEERSTSSSC